MFFFIACVALIVGIMLDAIDFLPFIVMLLSLLAQLSAIFLMMTYGPNAMMLATVCLGALGLASTWSQVAADLSVQNE
jgi:hypothetical protein